MNQTIQDHRPPRLPQRFLRWYCKPELLEDIEGDIHEDFNKRHTRSGRRQAHLYYFLDVLRFFRPFVIKKLFKTQNTNTMFKLNTMIAFRHLAKNKLYSFINITGLAIGIAACLIIAHYVIFQLSYDKFHENADRVYRVQVSTLQNGEDQGTGFYTGYALGPSLIRDVPEIEMQSRIHPYYGGGIVNRVVDSVSMTPFREQDILFVEPAFLQMFTFNFLQGNHDTALDDPSSIVITESTMRKYFGNEPDAVLGQILNVSGGWANGNYLISGVVEDFPANSHFQFDFLMPIERVLMRDQYTQEGTDWGWTNFYSYVMLSPQSTEEAAEAKMADLMHTYTPEDLEADGLKQTLSLQNVPDIHLRSEITGDEFGTVGNINSVYFMVIIAAFILLIAWINFINLSTAKATERSMEVGIKKAMGALKPQLMSQFLTESFWVNLFAIVLAIGLTYTFMPMLSEALGVDLAVDITNPVILASLGVLILIGPMLAGFYPALILSSFKTVTALKGRFVSKKSHSFSVRKGLVVFQFVISTFLIAGTFTVSRQLNFMQNQDTGIDMSKTLAIKGPETNISLASFESFKNNMEQVAGVEAFSSSRSIPGNGYNWGTEARRSGTDRSNSGSVNVTWVDATFLNTYGIDVMAGRDFTEAQRQAENGMIINEAAVKAFDLGNPENALTEKIILSGDTMAIRGVVKDHNWQSLHKAYGPTIFLYRFASADFFSLSVSPQNTEKVIRELEKQFDAAFPGNPVEYYFVNDFFNRQYKEDKAFANIFKAFSAFAIFAACMGLFGLASYSVVQKAKEIGIRRVLGASGTQITFLFSKRYLLLTIIANAIAIPITYFGIKSWLENFAFSIGITAELFLVPMVLLLIIAAVTISFQTIRAAMANPVKNLRSE